MAKVLEQGPVLILTFAAQQLMMVRNTKGEIVEGGEVSCTDVSHYIYILCTTTHTSIVYGTYTHLPCTVQTHKSTVFCTNTRNAEICYSILYNTTVYVHICTMYTYCTHTHTRACVPQ